ncbi:lipopolysaccharide heptosyltransferase II [Ectothiorhodospira sp. PHS-1]|uniref:glycosyltransferase family 9 protein n=1 Tax=Ectothiorhodospira sp. PHS-1 TaxID=519989 RepID=UPI00024A8985|nr:glycosyltransferase family 9 protein [Ectothiorhodospira sp. PHS-1]EHQ51350.1 lipopolysaccharide heptosyltransferase II [Ectothiorhodospira sp. PHS-1]
MQSLLIIRLSAIGDVVMASPLPAVFRAAWPDVRITWLVEPQVAGLVSRHPQVDRVVVWPKAQWRSLFRRLRWIRLGREVVRFVRELRAEPYDMAVDLQGLLKSGLLTRLSGARERVGLGSREGSGVFMTQVVPRGGDPRRIGSEYRYLAQALGLEPGAFFMQVGLRPEDEAVGCQVAEAQDARGYVVGCPFTTRPQKHWVEAAWAELARRIHQERGQPMVLLGGPDDRAVADRIQAMAGAAVDNRVGQTSLTQAAAVIRRAGLLVGVDTGLTHMGPAFDVPTVALFGSTCPYLDTGRDNTVVIYHDLPCAPCRRNPTCDGRFDCLTGISVDEVMTEVERLLPTTPIKESS